MRTAAPRSVRRAAPAPSAVAAWSCRQRVRAAQPAPLHGVAASRRSAPLAIRHRASARRAVRLPDHPAAAAGDHAVRFLAAAAVWPSADGVAGWWLAPQPAAAAAPPRPLRLPSSDAFVVCVQVYVVWRLRATSTGLTRCARRALERACRRRARRLNGGAGARARRQPRYLLCPAAGHHRDRWGADRRSGGSLGERVATAALPRLTRSSGCSSCAGSSTSRKVAAQ